MLAGELVSTNGIMISSRAEGWTSKKSPVKVTGRQFYCPEVEWNLKIQNCSQTRNPKVFPLGKTGNCGFQSKTCSLGSQQFVCMSETETDCWLWSVWHLSFQQHHGWTNGILAYPVVLLSTWQEMGGFQYRAARPLGDQGLWLEWKIAVEADTQTLAHPWEGIQPLGVTGSQDLSSMLRLLWVASHLGKTSKCPLSGLPALQSLLEAG